MCHLKMKSKGTGTEDMCWVMCLETPNESKPHHSKEKKSHQKKTKGKIIIIKKERRKAPTNAVWFHLLSSASKFH